MTRHDLNLDNSRLDLRQVQLLLSLVFSMDAADLLCWINTRYFYLRRGTLIDYLPWGKLFQA